MYIPKIVLEGNDLTGKTSFQKAMFRMPDCPVSKMLFTGDRGILTHYLYNQYFSRYPELESCYVNDLVDHLSNNGMVILTLNNASLSKRFKERGDDLYDIDTIFGMNSLYNANAEGLKNIPFVKVIEADDKSIAQTIAEATPWFNMMMHTDMSTKIWNLFKMIRFMGKTVGNTKELTNIRLQSMEKNLEASKFESMMDYFSGFAKMVEHSEYTMAIDNHAAFFTALKSKMVYIIKKEIKMYKQIEETSRRFHFTNDAGGCLNTVGINFRKNDKDGIECFITANFRSSDIAILPFDVFGVYTVISDLIRPKIAKQLFKTGFASKIEKFYLTFNLESAHMNFEDKLREYDNNANN